MQSKFVKGGFRDSYPFNDHMYFGDCGVLPTSAWNFPVFISIGLRQWRMENIDLDNNHPSFTRRMAMPWLHPQDDAKSILRKLLQISPLLIQLKVSRVYSYFYVFFIVYTVNCADEVVNCIFWNADSDFSRLARTVIDRVPKLSALELFFLENFYSWNSNRQEFLLENPM